MAAFFFNILIFRFLPKRFPQEITPLIVLLSISFPKIIDHSMAVKPFNYYDLTDTAKYELFDVILYGVYPGFGYLLLYLADYFDLKGIQLVLYFVGWTIFAVGFEYFLVHFHVFVYTGWKIIYSLPIYVVVIHLTYLFYKFIMSYRVRHPQ